MPLSATEKSALASTAQTILDEVNALVVDPAVNPLQAQLDAANASIATLQTANGNLQTTIAGLQGKIDAAKAALG